VSVGDPGLGTKVGTTRRERLLCVIPPYNGSKWYGYGANSMSKERKTNKEVKKKPTMTPKERKAVKKSRKEGMESQYR